MEIGVILGDVRTTVSPRDHLDLLLRQVEAAQRNGLTYITIGHHYLYGDLRWLQPVPTLARLAAELNDDVTLATTIIQAPLYHPSLSPRSSRPSTSSAAAGSWSASVPGTAPTSSPRSVWTSRTGSRCSTSPSR